MRLFAAIRAAIVVLALGVCAQRPVKELLRPLYYNPSVGTFTKEFYEGSLLAVEYYVNNEGMEAVGWDTVYIEVSEAMLQQHFDSAFYALGYIEGLETQRRMWQMFTNLYPPYWPFPAQWDDAMLAWSHNQTNYMRRQVADLNASSPYWKHIGGALRQVDGLVDGYNAAAAGTNETLTWDEVYALSMWFEMYDIRDATSVSRSGHIDGPSFGLPSRHSPHLRNGHCSGLIKVTSDDLYMAHDTWTPYNNMLRQYKVYNLTGIRSVAFSSYPGTLHSGDDWYLLDNGMTVMETSIDNFNQSSYRYISQNSVPEFMRVMAANTLATADGREWTDVFCENNGGTYNNQYMVINMNLFTPAAATPAERLPLGTFWLLEQMPLFCVRRDLTEYLRTNSYFGSYNIPFFAEIYEVSGTLGLFQEYGSFFSYTSYSRAEIFRRNQSQLVTLDNVKALMRYNDFRHDPLSLIPNCSGTTGGSCVPPYDASLSIASRMDLNARGSPKTEGPLWNYFKADYMGAIDSKIVRFSDMFPYSRNSTAQLVGHIISGPTVQPAYDIPPFRWSSSQWNSISHLGIPDLWDFPFVNSTYLLSPTPPPSP